MFIGSGGRSPKRPWTFINPLVVTLPVSAGVLWAVSLATAGARVGAAATEEGSG